jgi:hypothetical protein
MRTAKERVPPHHSCHVTFLFPPSSDRVHDRTDSCQGTALEEVDVGGRSGHGCWEAGVEVMDVGGGGEGHEGQRWTWAVSMVLSGELGRVHRSLGHCWPSSLSAWAIDGGIGAPVVQWLPLEGLPAPCVVQDLPWCCRRLPRAPKI